MKTDVTLPVLGLLCAAALAGAPRCAAMTSQDGYIRSAKNGWTLGTERIEVSLGVEKGQLVLRGLKDKSSGRELAPATPVVVLSSEILGIVGEGEWKFKRAKESRLGQGELQLDLMFSRDEVEVTRTYVVYPGSSVLRSWTVFRNTGTVPLKVVEPRYFDLAARLGGAAETIDFTWMVGAHSEVGTWTPRLRKLTPEYPQHFDSYDLFPYKLGHRTGGDGVDVQIALNGTPVWPTNAMQYCPPDGDERRYFDVPLEVKAGDRLEFVVHGRKATLSDATRFDPTVAYEKGEVYQASKQFGEQQGAKQWRYGVMTNGQWADMVYKASKGRWTTGARDGGNAPLIMAEVCRPGPYQGAVRQWVAPKEGTVRVTGYACNVGSEGLGIAPTEYKMGSETYAPWYSLYDRESKEGLIIGWDFMGHWISDFTAAADGTFQSAIRIAGHKQSLAPGESITLPKSFIALYREDLDNAGNELLNWQYRYLWDYTREGYFPAIPVMGYWGKGTYWGMPPVNGKQRERDIASQFTKIFRIADLMRYAGGDLYHRDWGWWDLPGDWNGPDFGASGRYLSKYGMRQILYAFIYTVNNESKVAREHPEWLIPGPEEGHVDMSMPAAVDHMKWQLDDFHKRWGDFCWRNDSEPAMPRNGDDTALLGQDQGFREVIRTFLDKYPKSSFQAVNSGGNEAGWEYVRQVNILQFTDGGIGALRNYWTTLLFPPDKLEDNGDGWDPNKYDKSTWRGLLECVPITMGDTWDKEKLESMRELFDIWHYLAAKGLVGRWVQVYRPFVQGDDPTMYLERLTRDRRCGIIIPGRTPTGAVTIRPKGLAPDGKYFVSFQESKAEGERTGADLMQNGIFLEKPEPGELIYLNVPMHPGSKRDREAPTAPKQLSARWGENMGYPGVEVSWKAGTDNNWISYYEISRDGKVIDKVAKGTFYFDHSAGADLAARYEIRTVDGAGNVSTPGLSEGRGARSQIIDDQDLGVKRLGSWKAETGLQPAFCETLSGSKEKGASWEAVCEGKRLLLFVKLGNDCGKAEIRVDDGPPEVIDTYCSDDVFGVCVYRSELLKAGKHTLKVTVTGECNARATDAWVRVDGVRAEPK